jgi:hypothetical protein
MWYHGAAPLPVGGVVAAVVGCRTCQSCCGDGSSCSSRLNLLLLITAHTWCSRRAAATAGSGDMHAARLSSYSRVVPVLWVWIQLTVLGCSQRRLSVLVMGCASSKEKWITVKHARLHLKSQPSSPAHAHCRCTAASQVLLSWKMAARGGGGAAMTQHQHESWRLSVANA